MSRAGTITCSTSSWRQAVATSIRPIAVSWRRSRSASTRRRRCSTSGRPRAACPARPQASGRSHAASGPCPSGSWPRPPCAHAREGVRVTPEQAYVFTILEPILCRYPETAELYAPEGRLLTAGDVFRFPDLGDALEAIAQEGPGYLYGGRARRADLRMAVRARRPALVRRLRGVQRDRARARGGRLPGPARAHQCAAVVGRGPDRLRPGASPAVGQTRRRWTIPTDSPCWQR